MNFLISSIIIAKIITRVIIMEQGNNIIKTIGNNKRSANKIAIKLKIKIIKSSIFQ